MTRTSILQNMVPAGRCTLTGYRIDCAVRNRNLESLRAVVQY